MTHEILFVFTVFMVGTGLLVLGFRILKTTDITTDIATETPTSPIKK